jgi:hypothetical protein
MLCCLVCVSDEELPLRQVSRRHQRLVRDGHAVVRLISARQCQHRKAPQSRSAADRICRLGSPKRARTKPDRKKAASWYHHHYDLQPDRSRPGDSGYCIGFVFRLLGFSMVFTSYNSMYDHASTQDKLG